jgi:hypothetical protein
MSWMTGIAKRFFEACEAREGSTVCIEWGRSDAIFSPQAEALPKFVRLKGGEFSPHFLATQYLRTKGFNPQFPRGIVSSVSFVSSTNTARSLAGFVSLAFALTPWRSPGSSEKLCPAS